MFKDALIIFKKELKNLFKDFRTIFAIFILPMILMPAIFIAIGYTTTAQQKEAVETVYNIKFVNLNDEEFKNILSQFLDYKEVEGSVTEENIQNSDNLIVVEFPENPSVNSKMNVSIQYNSLKNKSSFAANMVRNALNTYESELANEKLVEHGLTREELDLIAINQVDVAPEESQGTDFLAQMIPYFILIYIMAGSMNIGLDTTAGEKERGSLSSILVNQVSRTSIAMGKVLYVMTAGILTSIMTFIGLIVAFSFMFRLASDGGEMPEMNLAVLTPDRLLGLLIAMITVAGLASSIMVLLGSLARNMKEGGGYIMPFYILVIIMGVATMQMEASSNLGMYLIPFINSVFVMKDFITAQISTVKFLLMLISNVAVITLMIFGIARLYNSEKILESTE
ncbi:MAG: ABC transporter permease [Asgard group archaeon]|nr:ABC transporter permease [Asgard group archaeon]